MQWLSVVPPDHQQRSIKALYHHQFLFESVQWKSSLLVKNSFVYREEEDTEVVVRETGDGCVLCEKLSHLHLECKRKRKRSAGSLHQTDRLKVFPPCPEPCNTNMLGNYI